MEVNQAHQELDQTLPADLQDSVEFASANRISEVTGTPERVSEPHLEDSTMSGTATTPATSDQIAAAAKTAVEQAMASHNSQVQIASIIEKNMTAAATAQATAATLQAKVTELEGKLATATENRVDKPTDQRGGPTQENTTVPDADKDAKKWHGATPAAYAEFQTLQTQVNTLTAALAAKTKEVDDAKKKVDWDKKKADRTKKVTDAKIKSDKFKKRAFASKDDGSFVMADEEFDSALAELVEETGETAEQTEQAAAADGGGTPVAAPKDGAGPASKSKHPSLTGKGKDGAAPIVAPTDAAGPSSKQKHPKIAHASEGVPEGEAAEATVEGEVAVEGEATPVAPDLSTAEIMNQATAAILAQTGPGPNKGGVTKYAKAFGI